MKTIFKSMLLTALVMGMATAAMAQGGNVGITQDISVNARVLKPITLTGVQNVAFGGVFAGVNPFLDPKGQATASVGFTAAIGTVVVDATAGEPIRVEFPDTVHLVISGTANIIAYQPIISAYATGAAINTVNRDTSILIGSQTNPTGGAVTVAGTGTGPFGIIATSSAGSPADRARLLIGGKLGGTASPSTAAVLDVLPSNQPTGTYTGTLRLNLLYAL